MTCKSVYWGVKAHIYKLDWIDLGPVYMDLGDPQIGNMRRVTPPIM